MNSMAMTEGFALVSAPSATRSLRILLVEDSPDDAELVGLALRREGVRCSVRRVDTEPAMREVLAAWKADIVLCDYHLPRFSCDAAIAVASAMQPGVPVIVVSRHIEAEEAAEMMRKGAVGCVRKDRLERLAGAVRQAIHPDPRPDPPTEAA